VDRLDGGAGRWRHAERTEKKNGERRAEVGGRRLLFNGSVARAERKKGVGGPGVQHFMGEKTGKREGGPAAAWDSSVDCIGPRPVGAGGAVAAR
jgi:hypothetical protein